MKKVLDADVIRALVDNTPVAYIILDDQFRIHYINNYFLKLRNLSMEKIAGDFCYNISNGGKMCSRCAVKRALTTGKKAMLRRKDILADGTVRYIDDYAVPLRKKTGSNRRYVLEIMVNRTEEMLAAQRRDESYKEILDTFLLLLEAKDSYTATHSQNVRRIAEKLSRELKLDDQAQFNIAIAANLHDLGKVRISDDIINKKGKLDDAEYEMIKTHPVASCDMLRGLSSFGEIKKMVRQHHERYDGRGYPDKLSADKISLGAKIIAVADTYDAITSTRSYRTALSHEYALREIAASAGSQHDPDIVQAFLSMDFSDLAAGSLVPIKKVTQVERSLAVFTPQKIKKTALKSDFVTFTDLDNLLAKIFDTTPCGYVIMDRHQRILEANSYFLSYMGFSHDQIQGMVCYQAGGIGAKPCLDCPVQRCMTSGKMESARQEQIVNNSRKIFDMYAMPLKPDGRNAEYIAEIIIDRTREVLLNRRHERDFTKLISLLGSIYEEQVIKNKEYQMTEKLAALHEKLCLSMKNRES